MAEIRRGAAVAIVVLQRACERRSHVGVRGRQRLGSAASSPTSLAHRERMRSSCHRATRRRKAVSVRVGGKADRRPSTYLPHVHFGGGCGGRCRVSDVLSDGREIGIAFRAGVGGDRARGQRRRLGGDVPLADENDQERRGHNPEADIESARRFLDQRQGRSRRFCVLRLQPVIDIGRIRIDCAQTRFLQAFRRKSRSLFPPLNRAHIAVQIRCNFFPGVKANLPRGAAAAMKTPHASI